MSFLLSKVVASKSLNLKPRTAAVDDKNPEQFYIICRL